MARTASEVNRWKFAGRAGGAALLLILAGCGTPSKTAATAQVAVSRNAVENAASAGATELAPAEMGSARTKMMRANEALARKDYALALDLATQAEADAQLAQSKAGSDKASRAAAALQEDIRVLRAEVERANRQ
jgi:hypothetical protein